MDYFLGSPETDYIWDFHIKRITNEYRDERYNKFCIRPKPSTPSRFFFKEILDLISYI